MLSMSADLAIKSCYCDNDFSIRVICMKFLIL